MSFISLKFLLFTIIILIFYYIPLFKKLQVQILVLGSLIYFSICDFRFLWLLLFAVLATQCALLLSLKNKKIWIICGMLLNICLLAFFKYKFLFLSTSVSAGAETEIWAWLLALPLPVGISFFVFHNISFLVDFHKNTLLQKPPAMANTFLYIIFFPQLIAGPITRAESFFPQIQPKEFKLIPWVSAIRWIVIGFFMKSFCANNLNCLTVFLDTTDGLKTLGGLDRVYLLFLYSFQIYADFFGYSAMAVGLGLLFGYQLPVNFNLPYLAVSISDFWHRWHISLSTWLKHYLYIPLGGNRKGEQRTYLNLMLVMGIGGLWHGASLNYLAWGVFHGIFLCLERFFGSIVSKTQVLSFHPFQKFCGIAYSLGVFVFVSAAWMFFKMPNFEMLCTFVSGAISNPWAAFRSDYFYILGVIYALPVLLQHWFNKLHNYRAFKIMEPTLYAMMLFLAIVEAGPESAFIYFQF